MRTPRWCHSHTGPTVQIRFKKRRPSPPLRSRPLNLAPPPSSLPSPPLSPPPPSPRWADPDTSVTPNTGASALHSLGIYVNSNFDAGNADVVNVGSALERGVTHEIDLRIAPDPFCEREGKSHFQWYYFRVSGARGEQLR